MEIIASWLNTSFRLAGVVALRESRKSIVRRARRELRRVGILRFLDVTAFRLYYRLRLARRDRNWIDTEVARWQAQHPAATGVPRIVATSPNTEEVAAFLRNAQPDLVLARCKAILKPEIFSIPRAGTWVLHPGICPEYRNAHGCFWALANRDLRRVGMTLLQVDSGVDTGPVFLHAAYQFDEVAESHIVIQHRSVIENLDAIESTLRAALRGEAKPLSTAGRRSAVWGQPWLSSYLRWKRAARGATA